MFWNKIFGKNKSPKRAAAQSQVMESGNIKAVVLSDLGNIRMNNEDLGLFLRMADETMLRERGCLLLVADGMGGHQAGEVASRMAIDIVSSEYFNLQPANNIEQNLRQAFAIANKKIFEMSGAQKAYRGMGTTCTTLVLLDNQLYFSHAGDSRAYFIRDEQITQITEDHTYVQELLKKGELSAAEARLHPEKNILTNAMGTKPSLRIDTGKCPFSFEQDDRVLLCSDGLYDYLEDREIASLLQHSSLQDAAAVLVREAKKRGGHDNITVVIAEKQETSAGMPARETRDVVLPETKEYDLP